LGLGEATYLVRSPPEQVDNGWKDAIRCDGQLLLCDDQRSAFIDVSQFLRVMANRFLPAPADVVDHLLGHFQRIFIHRIPPGRRELITMDRSQYRLGHHATPSPSHFPAASIQLRFDFGHVDARSDRGHHGEVEQVGRFVNRFTRFCIGKLSRFFDELGSQKLPVIH